MHVTASYCMLHAYATTHDIYYVDIINWQIGIFFAKQMNLQEIFWAQTYLKSSNESNRNSPVNVVEGLKSLTTIGFGDVTEKKSVESSARQLRCTHAYEFLFKKRTNSVVNNVEMSKCINFSVLSSIYSTSTVAVFFSFLLSHFFELSR